MLRVFAILVLLVVSTIGQAVFAQPNEQYPLCLMEESLPSGCRGFENLGPDAVPGYPMFFTSKSATFPTRVEAEEFNTEYIAQGYQQSDVVDTWTDYLFGDAQYIVTGTTGPQGMYLFGDVVFLDDRTVASWSVTGGELDPLAVLIEVHEKAMQAQTLGGSDSQRTENALVRIEDLPDGYRLRMEVLSESFDRKAKLTDDELWATIEALQTKAATTPDTKVTSTVAPANTVAPRPTATQVPTKVPTPRPSPTPSSVISGPLEIIDISTKDAGIGNGSFYVYIDIRNVSGELLSYVVVDVTCRDSSGTVVATSIANTLNLAPGERAVLTAIVLNAPTCDRIEVQTNPVTGAI